MDKLKMDEFIAKLDIDLEIKNLLNEGLRKAHGNWFTFLHELEMVMVENEDFENAIHVRDTVNKMEEIIQRRKKITN
jgi:protein-arginine kinase activator protein McsA